MENEALTSTAKKRIRILSILLGTSVVISFLFLIYGLMQKAEANRQRHLTEFLQIQVDLQRKEAEACRTMVEQALLRSTQAVEDALQSSALTTEEAERKK
jgi:hypothetical protein